MGTSSSFRSPDSPRWNVLNRALDNQLPLERLRATLFLAGEAEWRDALRAPALATFAETLIEAHGALEERLVRADNPSAVIAAVLGEARSALFEHAYSPALPVAERALRFVLVQAVQQPVPLADATSEQAATAWQHNRGEPSDLFRRYVAAVFGQWSAHVLARDTARLCGPGTDRSAADVRQFTEEVSNHIAELAGSVTADLPVSDLGSHWSDVVSTVFDHGRRLERRQ